MQNRSISMLGKSRLAGARLATASIVAVLVTWVAFAALAASVSLDEPFTGAIINDPLNWNASVTGDDVCLTAAPSSTTIALASGDVVDCGGTPDGPGDGALRLTAATNNQAATVLYNAPLPLEGGLDITFSLSMWGGSAADGMSFFLKDGANSVDDPGAPGASLGYSLLRTSLPSRGISGALLGIGFDVFGSFSSPDVARDCDNATVGSGPGGAPNTVVVRGPDLSPGQDGSCGYFFLGSEPHDFGTGGVAAATRAEGARDVRIVVDEPSAADPKVKVFIGPVGALPTTPTLEVAQPAVFQTTQTFKFGFSASTGGQNQNHEVWGLGIAPAIPVTSVDARPPSSAPSLACSPQNPPIGATVTCEVTGGDAGIEILWNASVGAMGFAGQGVALDGSGAGTFTFVASVAGEVQVDLVDWGVDDVVFVEGPVPTGVPAGGGPVPMPLALLLAALVAAAGVLFAGRRMVTAG